jgi:kumamolisin
MESAAEAGMGIYHNKAQGEVRAREGSISVPADIAAPVEAVIGLDQRRVAKRRTTDAAAAVVCRQAGCDGYYNGPG